MPQKIKLNIHLLTIVLAAGVAAFALLLAAKPLNKPIFPAITKVTSPTVDTDFVPTLATKKIVAGLSIPWDVGFDPDGNLFYDERGGGFSVYANGTKRLLHKPSDLYVMGEGGMLGFTLDPEFKNNRQVYICFNSKKGGPDVRVVRFRIKEDLSGLEARKDIITGIPSNKSGRHSGCKPRFGSDGALWIGAGDAAIGSTAQDKKSLGGKVLRVDRDGNPVSGNLGSGFDPRIYSYGHRNIQGAAFYKTPLNGVIGYSVEQGSNRDDEVNELVQGNFGRDPVPGYNDNSPMTDLKKFPKAISAVWSSGFPTLATSGGTLIFGDNWGNYNNALAVAALKGSQLRIFLFDAKGKIKKEIRTMSSFGRLREAVMAPDGNLYVLTSNGGGKDYIIRITPSNPS